MDDIKTIQFDRFELLSAYLDGEVTAEERKQVETWLTTDPEFNQCYQQLLQMQRGFSAIPVPNPVSVDQTIEGVMARVERKPKWAIWATVGTAAAVAVAAITGLFSGGTFTPQTAQGPQKPERVAINAPSENLEPSDLLITIEQSPVDLPVAINVSNTDAP